MAITLQLAMLSKDLLDESSLQLDALFEFDFLSESQYLDVDDESILLYRLLTGLDQPLVKIVFEGVDSFSTLYKVDQQPKSISPSTVVEISKELQELDMKEIKAMFNTDLHIINNKYGLNIDRNVSASLLSRFKEIQVFFTTAAKNSYSIVVWWD